MFHAGAEDSGEVFCSGLRMPFKGHQSCSRGPTIMSSSFREGSPPAMPPGLSVCEYMSVHLEHGTSWP